MNFPQGRSLITTISITVISMSSRTLRVTLLLVLIVQMLHLPLPCPDLDGECRGTPILSLAEANAWHLMIAGVQPNDDIDRGPFRSDDSDKKSPLSDSPYGDLAVTVVTGSATMQCDSSFFDRLVFGIALSGNSFDGIESSSAQPVRPQDQQRFLDARTLRALNCVWRI